MKIFILIVALILITVILFFTAWKTTRVQYVDPGYCEQYADRLMNEIPVKCINYFERR